ncbi:MAG: phosphate-starvation-inducible PsiE family protein [Nitrospinota bacterium]
MSILRLGSKVVKLSDLFEAGTKLILSLLILSLLVVMSWIVLKSIIVLTDYWGSGIHEISKVVMVNVLMILALLEVYKTTLTYYTEGRVKVTYIIDTVLVVVLTEIMAFWFKEIEVPRLLMTIALVFALIIVRILAIRFSPDKLNDT